MILWRGELPGQKFVDAVDWVIGDLLEHAAETELWIQPVDLGRSQLRVDGGSAVTAGIGSTKQEVLPGQGYGT
jgi:hypothetical protein